LVWQDENRSETHLNSFGMLILPHRSLRALSGCGPEVPQPCLAAAASSAGEGLTGNALRGDFRAWPGREWSCRRPLGAGESHAPASAPALPSSVGTSTIRCAIMPRVDADLRGQNAIFRDAEIARAFGNGPSDWWKLTAHSSTPACAEVYKRAISGNDARPAQTPHILSSGGGAAPARARRRLDLNHLAADFESLTWPAR